jgi:uncharacterized protein YjiS (DUF1127 family)
MLEVSPSSRRRGRLVATLWRAVSWPARVAEARRTLAFLGQMTDRELSDIGLLRSDLADCAALPRDEDPSRRLAATRAARVWFAPHRRDGAPDGGAPILGEQSEGQPLTDLAVSAAQRGCSDSVGRAFGRCEIDGDGAGMELIGA